MYLKNDRIVATIKDVTFRSYRTGNEGQLILDPTALTGWDDGVNVRRDATVRPVTSGDFTEPYTFSARLIAFSGTAVAPNRVSLQALRDKLVGVLRAGEYGTLRVETSASTRYATVGLEGKVDWVQQSDNVAIFRVEYYAPDPHLYGEEKRTQAGAYVVSGGLQYPLRYVLDYHFSEQAVNRAVTNAGNAVSYPIFTANGDFYSGFAVYSDWGGKKVIFSGMVTREAPVTIDMKRGTATQNGVDRSALITERDWFGIEPFATINPLFSPLAGNDEAGSGWCDIIYRDTWI